LAAAPDAKGLRPEAADVRLRMMDLAMPSDPFAASR
jgi:hypothetical protein